MPYRAYQVDCATQKLNPSHLWGIIEENLKSLNREKLISEGSLIFQVRFSLEEEEIVDKVERYMQKAKIKYIRQI